MSESDLLNRIRRLLGEPAVTQRRSRDRLSSTAAMILVSMVSLALTVLAIAGNGGPDPDPGLAVTSAVTSAEASAPHQRLTKLADDGSVYPTIRGTVVDEHGEPVSGAKVIVREHQSKVRRRQVSGNPGKLGDLKQLATGTTAMDGRFEFVDLPIPEFDSYFDSPYPVSVVVAQPGCTVEWQHLKFVPDRDLPKLNELALEFPVDLVVMGVMNDGLSEAREAVAKHGVLWPNIAEGEDGPIQTQWNINSWPTNYLIGRDGKILAKGLRGEKLTEKVRELLKAERGEGDQAEKVQDEKGDEKPKDNRPLVASIEVVDANGKQVPDFAAIDAVDDVVIEVVDANGKQVPGALVRVWSQVFRPPPKPADWVDDWRFVGEERADSKGRVKIDLVDANATNIQIVAYDSNQRQKVGREGTQRRNLVNGIATEVTLAPAHKVSGRLIDYDSELPIALARLKIFMTPKGRKSINNRRN